MDHRKTGEPTQNGAAAHSATPGEQTVAAVKNQSTALRVGAPEVRDEFDARLTAALNRVSVPAGLAERLIATLEAAGEAQATETARHQASVLRFLDGRFRRSAAILAIAASLAIAVTAVWVIGSRQPQPLEPAELVALWYSNLLEKPPQWRSLESAPKGFAIPDSVVANAAGYELTHKAAGRKGVVYKLNGARVPAVLFVVQMPEGNLPSRPPIQPQSTTGGLTIGVWQNGPLRYALVVAGDERDYGSLIKSVAPPLAGHGFSNPPRLASR